MKKALKTLWSGLTDLVSAIFYGIATLFGMRDDTKYSKVLRRIVGTCFAAILIALVVNFFANEIRMFRYRHAYQHTVYISNIDNTTLSGNVNYHEDSYYSKGYVFTNDGKRTIENVAWVSLPLGNDSLVCYSIGNKRGYFNLNTGLVAIAPEYPHAWVFSEGLAAVDDKGWIKFVDQTGRVVIDNHTPYKPNFDGYVFHSGYCAVNEDINGNVGLINKDGNWALEPNNRTIYATESFWIVNDGEASCVLSKSLDTIITPIEGEISYSDGLFVATMKDHTIRTYSTDGEIVEPFLISDVEQMIYDTDIIHERKTQDYDDGYETFEQVQNRAVAKCRKYEAEFGWYGLMSNDGRVITLPSFNSITAIGPDLYLCEYDCSQGVILNGRGHQVK